MNINVGEANKYQLELERLSEDPYDTEMRDDWMKYLGHVFTHDRHEFWRHAGSLIDGDLRRDSAQFWGKALPRHL